MEEKAELHPAISQYHEAIIIMMRYGTSVDHIAKRQDLPEKGLVDYIKKEGLDKQMARRSWTWNSNHKYRRKPRKQDKKKVYSIRTYYFHNPN